MRDQQIRWLSTHLKKESDTICESLRSLKYLTIEKVKKNRVIPSFIHQRQKDLESTHSSFTKND
jgi:hypothetical protein